MVKMATAAATSAAAANQSGLATGSEGLVCFVCDVGVVGRYYALATCRTQTTKVRLIEKLGQLVGEEYMVIISQDDIICRGCATMINSLDRLEKELGSIRSIVLRYLEKKYDLEEGELVNTRSNQPISVKPGTPTLPPPPADFQSRKRRAMTSGETLPDDVKNTGKDSSWLQCDKCKYTTNYGSFMAHHARSHKKKEMGPPQATTSGVQQQSAQQVSQQDEGSDVVMMDADTGKNGKEAESETIIAGDIGEAGGGEAEMIAAADLGEGFTSGQKGGQMLAMVEVENKVTLQAVETEDGSNTLCMVDENGIIVQKVEQAEDGTLYVHVPDGSDAAKQVLSVADDGSVQMVEVLWDDMVSPDETESHSMVTF